LNPLNHLKNLLDKRQEDNLMRILPIFNAFTPQSIDFFSNDYLGVAQNPQILALIQEKLEKNYTKNIENTKNTEKSTKLLHFAGATGSRLISGNIPQATQAEKYIAEFHNAENSLIFSTGYSANIGLLACLATENDYYLSDQLIHASMIDGVRLSNAQKLRFRHNDMAHLEVHLQNIQKNKAKNLEKNPEKNGFTYILIESIYSMDGDVAPLAEIYTLAQKYEAYVVIDEAHALAVYGEKGEGFAHEYAQNPHTLARIYTFGKGFGSHGAVIVGSNILISYLVNFARSFIYSTALAPLHYAYIEATYGILKDDFLGIFKEERQKLHKNIAFFQKKVREFLGKINLKNNYQILPSDTAIQTLIIGGNTETKALENHLRAKKFLVKAILSPTIPQGTERLRLCLHSFNTFDEIERLFLEL
jgi:8-amino-7-oxononanoate synthase